MCLTQPGYDGWCCICVLLGLVLLAGVVDVSYSAWFSWLVFYMFLTQPGSHGWCCRCVLVSLVLMAGVVDVS
jgi:hypothetical protein